MLRTTPLLFASTVALAIIFPMHHPSALAMESAEGDTGKKSEEKLQNKSQDKSEVKPQEKPPVQNVQRSPYSLPFLRSKCNTPSPTTSTTSQVSALKSFAEVLTALPPTKTESAPVKEEPVIGKREPAYVHLQQYNKKFPLSNFVLYGFFKGEPTVNHPVNLTETAFAKAVLDVNVTRDETFQKFVDSLTPIK